jgi:hypothetical protein
VLALAGWGQAADAFSALGDGQLDGVTAAQIHMDLELSATAHGPTVMTSTQGSVTTGRTSAVRVAIDPTAPPEARARLLGTTQVDVGIAAGQAQAAGAADATCSANTNVSGADYTYITRSQTFTAMTANCSCTALAIGFLSH